MTGARRLAENLSSERGGTSENETQRPASAGLKNSGSGASTASNVGVAPADLDLCLKALPATSGVQ